MTEFKFKVKGEPEKLSTHEFLAENNATAVRIKRALQARYGGKWEIKELKNLVIMDKTSELNNNGKNR